MSSNYAPFSPAIVGFFRYDTVASPGAGNNFTYTAPNGVLRCVQSVRFVFSAGAAVADRYAILQVKNQGSTVTVTAFSQVAITAAAVNACYFDINGPDTTMQDLPARTVNRDNLPPIWLLPGDTLGSAIANLQALDTITQIQIASICYAWV